MDSGKIDEFLAVLAEIGAFLVKIKHRNAEMEQKAQISETVERYLDGFVFSKGGDKIPGRKRVDSLSMQGEKEELIKLKYGQGSICRKIRVRKKDNSIYVIYEGRYYNEYGKIKSVYAKTQRECARLLKEAHPCNKKDVVRKPAISVSEWVLSWYNTYKKDTVRASTRRNYESNVKVIMDALGKYKLKDLNGELLQVFFNGIEHGNTRKKLYVFLKSCLEKAVVLKKIEFNPCGAVELPKFKKQRRRPFTYEEQEIFCNVASPKLAQAVFFLCATGLRVGEFLALRKEDFFFEEHFFKVDKAVADGIEGETKTESSNRVVYFTDKLFEHFNIDLLGTFTYSGLRTSFQRFCTSHGIKGISLHSTRHTFSTICHRLGLNDKILQTLMGHSTLAMTQDTYTHLLKKGASKVYFYLEELCTFICTIC